MQANPSQLQEVRTLLSFIQPFFGASILMCFFVWLRARQVRDHSLIWLSVTLLCFSIPAGLAVLTGIKDYPDPVKEFWSAAANILITISAFRLLRVQDAIRLYKLDRWPTAITSFIAVGSLTAWLLKSLPGNYAVVGLNIDAVMSLLALVALGLCVTYSFYKYGNQPLMALTLIDFAYVIWYQFHEAERGGAPVTHPVLVALNITSVAIMTMLFIALTLAWGLSHASRLRFRDSEMVDVIVMFIDIRNSTEWAKKVGDGAYVVKFINKFTEWALSRASQGPHGLSNNVKHVGDGVMLVWEVTNDSSMLTFANAIVGLGYSLTSGYESWVKSNPCFYKEVPRAIGVGVAFGPAQRLTSENGSYDHSGLAVNLASKLQNLARPESGVVILDDWTLSNELADKFTRRGKMQIGNDLIPVRATEGVRLLTTNGNGSSRKV
jgi:class 3 adenylate cyclase